MRASALVSIVGLILLVPATAQAGGYAPLADPTASPECESEGFHPADQPPFGGEIAILSSPLQPGAVWRTDGAGVDDQVADMRLNFGRAPTIELTDSLGARDKHDLVVIKFKR